MRPPLRAVRAACLAPGLALALCAGDGAAAAPTADLIRPFAHPMVAAADSGETAVLWRAADGSTRAAIGTPGEAFRAPVALPGVALDADSVHMDAAGDVVVVWEATASRLCNRVPCSTDSLGVFAVVRPAGGTFRAPLRLSAEQPSQLAQPRVAMNRAGDWVVALKRGSETVVGAGRGATAPSAFAALPAAGFEIQALGIDEAGDTTFAGKDASHHPATIVRRADGSYGALQVLDDASIEFRTLALGVGPQGHAVAVWPGGGFLRSASRQPGGSFGMPVSSGVAEDDPPQRIGVDGQGRTIMVLSPRRILPAPASLQVRRGTIAAPFGEPATLTAPNDYGGVNRFAIGAGGSAVLSWTEVSRGNRVARVAIASDAGPFSAPLDLSRGTSDAVDLPAVAIDGAGRAILAWTSTIANVQRLLVAALTPAAVTGPSVVAQGAPTPRPVAQARAAAPARQVLLIRPDGTVRPKLTCVSAGSSCRGILRIDVRPAPGRKFVRMGSHRFLFAPGRSQRVIVRTTRAARRAAGRRRLTGRITVTTLPYGASRATLKDVVAVTVRRTGG